MATQDIKADIEIIGGGLHHGRMKAAATALDVSDRTIHRAYTGASCSQKLADKIRVMAVAARSRHEKTLSSQAGKWSIGHVGNCKASAEAIDEVTVLHLSNPSFVMHVEMLRGKAEDGGARWGEDRIRWYDEPSDEGQRSELANIAREKGRAAVYERSIASAEIEMRKRKMASAERYGAMERSELSRLSPLALSAEAEGVDVDRRIDEMSAEIGARHKALGSHLCRQSAELGQWIAAYKMACIVKNDVDQSFLPAYITAKAYKILPKANVDTVRGRIEINAETQATAPTPAPKAASNVVTMRVDVSEDVDRAKAAGAVRAHIEAHYAQKALNAGERAFFDQKLRDELTCAS